MHVLRFILNLFFPRSCAVCGQPLEDADVCGACLERIPVRGFVFCSVCNRRLPGGEPCRLHRFRTPLAGLGVVGDYRDPAIRKLIHHYKYGKRRGLAAPLAELLARHAAIELLPMLASDKPIVIPIPLTRRRESSRGFNQSALLAERFAQTVGLPYANGCLVRVGNHPPQAKLPDAKLRRENIRNVFRIAGNAPVSGKTILLVDDVASSGATLEEAARMLKDAGAKTVWGLVIARGM